MDDGDDKRTVLAISGADRIKFLQDLVTNDVSDLSSLIYAALLSPQGKYLFDFFLFERDETVFLDVKKARATQLAARLGMYKLRADVTIETTDLSVARGLGALPNGAFADPRDPSLGWRVYGVAIADEPGVDWNALRVAAGVPETDHELIYEQSYILEAGFERLNGVDFRKGCYVGQEVTARMKHKTELRKGLAVVELDGQAKAGAEITLGDRPVGTLHSVCGNKAIAYLRFDRAGRGMTAGGAAVNWNGL